MLQQRLGRITDLAHLLWTCLLVRCSRGSTGQSARTTQLQTPGQRQCLVPETLVTYSTQEPVNQDPMPQVDKELTQKLVKSFWKDRVMPPLKESSPWSVLGKDLGRFIQVCMDPWGMGTYAQMKHFF